MTKRISFLVFTCLIFLSNLRSGPDSAHRKHGGCALLKASPAKIQLMSVLSFFTTSFFKGKLKKLVGRE